MNKCSLHIGRPPLSKLTISPTLFDPYFPLLQSDIKIDNILLSQSWVAKLTDFGFAKEAIDSEGFTVLSDTFCGTRPYYSPQIVLRTPYSPFKADIYALGVVLYAMMHNRFPFHFKDNKQMAEEQLDLDYRLGR